MNCVPAPIEKIIENFNFLSPLFNEDILNLENVPVIEWEDVEKCDKYLSINKKRLPYCIKEIPFECLVKLFLIASRMHTECVGHVTGLKMYFGVDPDSPHCISLLFQPVFLRRDKPYIASKGEYTVIESDACYTLEKEKLIPASQDKITFLRTNYENNIQIKHHDDCSQHSGFIQGEDTESVIFPFQTFFTLICDNFEPKGDELPRNIFIHNHIRLAKDQKNKIKHSLLLTYNSILLPPPKQEKLKLKLEDLHGKFANRSHLCPPDCNLLKYAVYESK